MFFPNEHFFEFCSLASSFLPPPPPSCPTITFCKCKTICLTILIWSKHQTSLSSNDQISECFQVSFSAIQCHFDVLERRMTSNVTHWARWPEQSRVSRVSDEQKQSWLVPTSSVQPSVVRLPNPSWGVAKIAICQKYVITLISFNWIFCDMLQPTISVQPNTVRLTGPGPTYWLFEVVLRKQSRKIAYCANKMN